MVFPPRGGGRWHITGCAAPGRGGGEPGLFSTWRAGVAREVLSLPGPEPAEPSDRRRSSLALWEAGSSGPRSRGRGVRPEPPSRPTAHRLPSPTHEDSTARTPTSPGPGTWPSPNLRTRGKHGHSDHGSHASPLPWQRQAHAFRVWFRPHTLAAPGRRLLPSPPPPPRGPRTGKRAAPSVRSCGVENWTRGP